MESKIESWLDVALEKHARLTSVVAPLVESLLKDSKVPYLAVRARTKDRSSAIEKIERKGYKSPEDQITDLSGIRIIVYFESDVERVSKIIESSFSVDSMNSLNRDALMSVDQTGYRSVHYVCDLGEARASLPEFSSLKGMKFEFQVRTVLQHAWAELAHDGGYKFSGKLPREMERKLYLYAGMLEIADKGFDELSQQIDEYVASMAAHGVEKARPIDSLSLQEFVRQWSMENGFPLEVTTGKDLGELVLELKQFGISDLEGLSSIIPKDYSSRMNAIGYSTNIYGLVRDWMIIRDWRKLVEDVEFTWGVDDEDDGNVGAMRDYLGEDFDLAIGEINTAGWLRG